MPTSSEVQSASQEAQVAASETMRDREYLTEYTRAQVDTLQQEVHAVSKASSEVKSDLSSFLNNLFNKFKSVITEIRNNNRAKAFSIIFWSEEQDSQSQETEQTSSGTWTESTSSEQTSTDTWTQQSSSTTAWTESKEKEPKEGDFVEILKYIPGITYDIKYATADNFIKQKIYDTPQENLKLKYKAVKRLKRAEELAEKQWYKLKIRDAYRPVRAQEKLWDEYDKVKPPLPQPKTHNVACPKTRTKPDWRRWNWSNHWEGTAIDLTLLDANGKELEMPTEFDVFKGCKRSEVNKLPNWDERKKNALKLKEIMNGAWFIEYKNERWHYDYDESKII